LAALAVVNIINTLDDDDDKTNEWMDGDFSVIPDAPVYDYLSSITGGHESIFARETGFLIAEWNELVQKVCPVINSRSRDGTIKVKPGRPPKLNAEQRLLNCIIHLKKVQRLF
jgi:hypothetical protein